MIFIFYMKVQFLQNNSLNRISFVRWIILAPLYKTDWLTIYVQVYFRILYSVPLIYVNPYTTAILSWSPELSSKSWNQVVWVPQLVLFSKLFWIVQLSSIPIYILDLAWQCLQKSLLRLRWLHSIYISIWEEKTFLNDWFLQSMNRISLSI